MKKIYKFLICAVVMFSLTVIPAFAEVEEINQNNYAYTVTQTETVEVGIDTYIYFDLPFGTYVSHHIVSFTFPSLVIGYGDILFEGYGVESMDFDGNGTEIRNTACGLGLWLNADTLREVTVTVTTYYVKTFDAGYAEGYDMGQERYRSELAWLLYANGYKQGYYELANNPTEAYRVLEELIYMQLGSDDWYKGYDEGYKKGLTEGTFSSVSDAYNDLSDKILEGITQTHKDMQNSIDDSANGSFIQGFLAGMWNGMTNFMQMILTGVTFSDLSLMNILATAIAILTAVFIIKMVKG